MDLTEEDVIQILKLIDESKFDYFQLEVGDLKIAVSKGDPIAVESTPRSAPAQTPGEKAAPAAPERPRSGPAARAAIDGLVPITAPLLGTFYVAPEPGAAPFIEAGAAVDDDTTVGLIEVMKVFNGVCAGVKGVIAEVVAQNGQFVEYGQTLFLVKPAGKTAAAREAG